eukprot:2441187-Pleurochrysis_carterae.AAC.1
MGRSPSARSCEAAGQRCETHAAQQEALRHCTAATGGRVGMPEAANSDEVIQATSCTETAGDTIYDHQAIKESVLPE